MSLTLWFAICALAHWTVLTFGHGGGLHPLALDRYVNMKVATCNSFQPLDTVNIRPGLLPFFGPTMNLTVTGGIEVYVYLPPTNCTVPVTTTMVPKLNFTIAGNTAPYAGKWVYAYGFTGNCSAPIDFYRNNVTLGDNRFNLLWFNARETITDANGGLIGAAPNTWMLREANATDPLGSILMLPESGPVMCCNVQYVASPRDILAKGKVCNRRRFYK